MQVNTSKTELVGFIELQVGSIAVKLPIRNDPEPHADGLPKATFVAGADESAIIVYGDPTRSKAMDDALGEAAQVALRHFSNKLLN